MHSMVCIRPCEHWETSTTSVRSRVSFSFLSRRHAPNRRWCQLGTAFLGRSHCLSPRIRSQSRGDRLVAEGQYHDMTYGVDRKTRREWVALAAGLLWDFCGKIIGQSPIVRGQNRPSLGRPDQVGRGGCYRGRFTSVMIAVGTDIERDSSHPFLKSVSHS